MFCRILISTGLASALAIMALAASAQAPASRIAFVVGNAAYMRGPLPSPVNDAGLVAEALNSIGFETVEGADLTRDEFFGKYREFLARLDALGPNTTAFVYFAGYGLEYDGDNFLMLVDSQIERASDVPVSGIPLSDVLAALAERRARAKIVALDAARARPLDLRGRPLARGLAALDAPSGMLIGYSAAPGTVSADATGDYGRYAVALAEMLRDPGLDLDIIFLRVRSRVHQITAGRQTPWHVGALPNEVILLPRENQSGSAPAPRARATRPMRELGLDEAYAAAIEIDTINGYVDFLQSYPRSPYERRVYAMLRARREATTWLRAVQANTPDSFWTYLQLYPNGAYGFDAERRLRRLSSGLRPRSGFVAMTFADVPPPLEEEPAEFVDVELEQGPRPPARLIGPPPAPYAHLPPAPVRNGADKTLPVAISLPAAPNTPQVERRKAATAAPQDAGAPPPAALPSAPAAGPAASTEPGAAPVRPGEAAAKPPSPSVAPSPARPNPPSAAGQPQAPRPPAAPPPPACPPGTLWQYINGRAICA